MNCACDYQEHDHTGVCAKEVRLDNSVNYKPFKNNRLIRKKDLKIHYGINNYGMILRKNKCQDLN